MNASNLQRGLASRRILRAGASGQVGVALQQAMPEGVELLELDRNALDITDRNNNEKSTDEGRREKRNYWLGYIGLPLAPMELPAVLHWPSRRQLH